MHSDQTQRYFFEVAYRGTAYHGWQKQNNAHSVQAEIENACEKLWPQGKSITGSGRTDTGVHCEQQYFHIDLPLLKDPGKAAFRLNRILPSDIAIGAVRPVSADAHARFSATSRAYEYRICRRKNVFKHGLTYYYHRELDVALMNSAAAFMKNFEDFQAFSKVRTDVNHYKCDILEAKWESDGADLIFYVRANRFLRGMVRAMVGTLMLIGKKKITMEEFGEILASRERKKAGASVPPEGLFLVSVEYPEEIYLDRV